MKDDFNTPAAKDLYEAILLLENKEECNKFFRDLCTFTELNSMIERFQVAKKVDNKETYRNINKDTGTSSATITRVAHWLHHWTGGYDLILKRMK